MMAGNGNKWDTTGQIQGTISNGSEININTSISLSGGKNQNWDFNSH